MSKLAELKKKLNLVQEKAVLLTKELNDNVVKLPTSLSKPGSFEEKLKKTQEPNNLSRSQ